MKSTLTPAQEFAYNLINSMNASRDSIRKLFAEGVPTNGTNPAITSDELKVALGENFTKIEACLNALD